MRPKYRHPVAVVLLVGVVLSLLAAALVWEGSQPYSEASQPSALVPVLTALFAVIGVAAWLYIVFLTASWNVSYLKYAGVDQSPNRLIVDLNSSELGVRRLALQTLADNLGHPFGFVSCWPIQRHSPVQFEMLVELYKEWLLISRDAWKDGTIAPHVVRRLRTPVNVVLSEVAFAGGSGVPEPSPDCKLSPLSKEEFIRGMRRRIDLALDRMADALNRDSHGCLVATTEEVVRDLLARLFWDALEMGLRLRTDPGRRDAVTGIRQRSDRITDRAADAVKDAVLDWDPEDEARPPDVHREALPPLEPERFVGVLRGRIEDVLKDVAESLNKAADVEDMAASEAEIRALVDRLVRDALTTAMEMRIDAAVARLPAAAAKGEWVEKFRRMKAVEGRTPPGAAR